MLRSTLSILLLISGILAQDPSSLSGIQFVCPAGAQALQAFSTICPLTLSDGSASLNTKVISNANDGAPFSYKTSLNSITITCLYGRLSPAIQGTGCSYTAGAGQRVTLESGQSKLCPATTVNNGNAPQPSPGTNFRKRQSASAVQMRQPLYTCPRQETGAAIYQTVQSHYYQPATAGPFIDSLYCQYNDPGPDGNFGCVYTSSTGEPRAENLPLDDRCPTKACPSPEYVAQMRKRAIDVRQVKAANLRGKRAAPAVEAAGLSRRKSLGDDEVDAGL